MSTRSNTHFNNGESVHANIYRHSDGYPEGHGKDLVEFLKELKTTLEDPRLDDPSYLAAKLVVRLANKSQEYGKKESPYDFLGVGVYMEDAGDIEYLYTVDCADINPFNGLPRVICQAVTQSSRTDDPPTFREVKIPGYTPGSKAKRIRMPSKARRADLVFGA